MRDVISSLVEVSSQHLRTSSQSPSSILRESSRRPRRLTTLVSRYADVGNACGIFLERWERQYWMNSSRKYMPERFELSDPAGSATALLVFVCRCFSFPSRMPAVTSSLKRGLHGIHVVTIGLYITHGRKTLRTTYIHSLSPIQG